jgi:hypothetical protein
MKAWLRWLGLWSVLVFVLGLLSQAVIAWLMPWYLVWGSAFVLASAVMLLLVPTPHDD